MAGFISLADAKAQMRVRHAGEDALIQRLINAASRAAERHSGYVAGERQHTFQFDCFDRELELRLRPVKLDTIEIRYLDQNGQDQAFADFRAIEKHGTTRLLPAIGACWPPTIRAAGAIRVSATVGFEVNDAEGAINAPEHVLHAVRVCVAKWFNDREEGPLPPAFEQLLEDERLRRV
ncbi:head-tail connector protein [Novosphingobium album (ex Liu et al. 2023)]|uniref:Phage head-tail connector protein n=1 Tax=Novosphingobium album (ex Liu et al. 2023) TaxID=3031130 RepID=A0ABT5WPA7_9SPHN|nr:phage head-tail connector protein [Novosphingobium album (ex Liu et al. 2023)]MDE8651877.1 phage head-tail connector protein [Novosphingobium album (ex Liu et al. 2023)]